jgi:hypothetical protein
MLTERFQLVSHSEKKAVPVYALTVGKKGLTIALTAGPAATDAPALGDGPCSGGLAASGFVYRECRGVYNAAMANNSGGSPADAPVSFFDAVDKLGLKLENRKLPVDTIVVDSILRTPVEN